MVGVVDTGADDVDDDDDNDEDNAMVLEGKTSRYEMTHHHLQTHPRSRHRLSSWT